MLLNSVSHAFPFLSSYSKCIDDCLHIYLLFLPVSCSEKKWLSRIVGSIYHIIKGATNTYSTFLLTANSTAIRKQLKIFLTQIIIHLEYSGVANKKCLIMLNYNLTSRQRVNFSKFRPSKTHKTIPLTQAVKV